jgi:hypothetical protein
MKEKPGEFAGIGEISWTDSDKIRKVSLREGDVYSLKSGSLFYIHSSTQAEKMIKIIAIFDNPEEAQLQVIQNNKEF